MLPTKEAHEHCKESLQSTYSGHFVFFPMETQYMVFLWKRVLL